jgi:lipoate-protein ligase A
MTASQYKKAFGITDEKIKEDGKTSIRDYMSDIELERIKRVEEDINGLIKYGGIVDIETLTKKIMEMGV